MEYHRKATLSRDLGIGAVLLYEKAVSVIGLHPDQFDREQTYINLSTMATP